MTNPTNTSTSSTPIASTDNWKEQKSRLIAKFPTLTDADLKFENGKKDEMLSKLQVKLGKSKEDLATVMASV